MGNVLFMRKGETHSEPVALPPKGKTLNDYTWEEISLISFAGKAREYFSVGDRKAIAINGTVGTQSINTTLYAYIIGFDHNGTTNTVDFGTFKDANGDDICLVDSNHLSTGTSGNKWFNMNHDGNYNKYGWKGCDLRYDILGSTDVNNGDATENCPINPVANTLMAALPAELRAVMKPMTIYTDNVADKTNVASNVTASVDYLPLLAEWEVYGSQDEANSAEQNYQKQYAYYSAGNSKVKSEPSSIDPEMGTKWWMRSPYTGSDTAFCMTEYEGRSSSYGGKYSLGIAPIFRV